MTMLLLHEPLGAFSLASSVDIPNATEQLYPVVALQGFSIHSMVTEPGLLLLLGVGLVILPVLGCSIFMRKTVKRVKESNPNN